MEKVKCTTCGTENPENYKYCSNCDYELSKIQTENLDNTILQHSKEKADKRNKLSGIIVGAIFFALASFAVQQLFFKAPLYDKVMMQVASTINESCPIMVDAETRLDNSVALPDNVFQYNYTLLNIEKATEDTEGMRNYLEPTITNMVKTSPDMKYMRDHKATINYYYKDKDGNFLFLISLTPDKYE